MIGELRTSIVVIGNPYNEHDRARAADDLGMRIAVEIDDRFGTPPGVDGLELVLVASVEQVAFDNWMRVDPETRIVLNPDGSPAGTLPEGWDTHDRGVTTPDGTKIYQMPTFSTSKKGVKRMSGDIIREWWRRNPDAKNADAYVQFPGWTKGTIRRLKTEALRGKLARKRMGQIKKGRKPAKIPAAKSFTAKVREWMIGQLTATMHPTFSSMPHWMADELIGRSTTPASAKRTFSARLSEARRIHNAAMPNR